METIDESVRSTPPPLRELPSVIDLSPRLPSLTLVLPVLNEETALPRALRSIAAQDYPREFLEVLVVDGGSTDGSKAVVETFSDSLDIRLVDNSVRREAEWGKALGLREARGTLFQCMDADMWLTAPDMLRALAKPLADDHSLAGSIAPYAFIRETCVWNRVLSCDPLQRDPLLEVLTPSLEANGGKSHNDYVVLEFREQHMPPIGGTTMFRREGVDLDRWGGVFRDVDHAAYLVKEDQRRFAFLPELGWGHAHCQSLGELVAKRVRNLQGLSASFLSPGTRDFTWWDMSQRAERLRLIRWVIGTNLIVPRLVEGVARAVRRRRWEFLLRPVVAVVVTDSLILTMLASTDGRRFVCSALAGKASVAPR